MLTQACGCVRHRRIAWCLEHTNSPIRSVSFRVHPIRALAVSHDLSASSKLPMSTSTGKSAESCLFTIQGRQGPPVRTGLGSGISTYGIWRVSTTLLLASTKVRSWGFFAVIRTMVQSPWGGGASRDRAVRAACRASSAWSSSAHGIALKVEDSHALRLAVRLVADDGRGKTPEYAGRTEWVDDGARVDAGVDGDLRNPAKGMLPERIASRALPRRVRRPEFVAKLGGVASEHPAQCLGVLERQHLRHAAAQVLLKIGPVPADGGGRAGQAEAVLAEDGLESGSLWVVRHGGIG